MDGINKLQAALLWHGNGNGNGKQIKCLVLFLVAQFRVRTVTLGELVGAFRKQGKAELRCERLKRVSPFEANHEAIAGRNDYPIGRSRRN